MAKTNLVPIRVKIYVGKHPYTGKTQHIYPDFNQIASAVREGMDWSEYFDARGTGWHYDKVSDFGKADAYNPDHDMWYGCTCVPKAFANAAVAQFPTLVEILTEADFETFYETRSTINQPDEIYDTDALQAIQARRALNLVDTDDVTKALDPNNDMPGIRKNKSKKWSDFKTMSGVTIDSTVAKQT